MLSAPLLAGLFAVPIATAALFLPATGRTGRAEERWRWIGRLTLTLVSGTLLIAAVVAILALIGITARNLEAAAVGLALAIVVWLPITRRWGARAHLCWAMTTYVFVVYLVFMIWWTFASHLGIAGTAGGLVLWFLELVAAGLGCAYLWELCDTLGRASRVRRVGTQELAEVSDGPCPLVCLQVPRYNEPPDMVIETLTSLLSLDYPNYEIQVLDDNTDDEDLWRPVEAWCREHDVKFVHLSDWPGYKSGALNYALDHMVEDSCELIGVIDSDYQIEPQFLRRCAPPFADASVGFIQAPQDYRDERDGSQVPLWFATACDASARALAASWWRNVLGTGDRSGPLALSLTGATINGASAPLTLLAGAAAATARRAREARRAGCVPPPPRSRCVPPPTTATRGRPSVRPCSTARSADVRRMAMHEVPIAPRSAQPFTEVIGDGWSMEFAAALAAARDRLDGSTLWHVNSTATGGGVAEMLQSVLSYPAAADIDVRWLVIDGDAGFFELTKRVHHLLHGSAGDEGPLGDEERQLYEETLKREEQAAADRVQRGDVVVLHDPQVLGLAHCFARLGAVVIWSCHIGADQGDRELPRAELPDEAVLADRRRARRRPLTVVARPGSSPVRAVPT
jgi:Glycosyl transferase family 2